MAPEKLLAEWFWIDRWVGSSAFGLPQEARGVYREMLTQAWRRGARLPNDHDTIQRYTGTTPAEWRRSWPKIEKFWRIDGDCLVNDTQLEIYAEAKRRMSVNEGRAKAGAKARWKQSLSDAQASAQAKPEQCAPVSGIRSPISEVPSELLRRPRGQPPMALGLRRLKFWRWMADAFFEKLGIHAEDFDLTAWLQDVDEHETRVITGDWWAYWLPLFEAEVRRRGLPLAATSTGRRLIETTPEEDGAAVLALLHKEQAR